MTLTLSLLLALIATAGISLWLYLKKERTQNLRNQFGPECDKAIGHNSDRVQRAASFHILPLTTADRARFTENWRQDLARFVENPRAAVRHADILVQQIMERRGYPLGDFDQHAADLSADLPSVVENYRIAHEIALRQHEGVGNTEDLRKAMLSYRILLENLLLETVHT